MALLDFLKNKKEAEKAKEKKVSEKKTEKASVVKKAKQEPKETATQAPVKTGKKALAFDFNAVREPHISEKSTIISEKNQYVFKVAPSFNKNEIKKSVEGLYGVNVLSVNIIKIPPKKRRIGRTEGFKKGYKKAVVKIAEGQKIEIL
jgi:large subunit ribosomal protein L23